MQELRKLLKPEPETAQRLAAVQKIYIKLHLENVLDTHCEIFKYSCMKKFTLLSLFILVFTSSLAIARDELETIHELLELYRPQSMEKYGKPIAFTVKKNSDMNASASARLGGPSLTITTGALESLIDDEALSTMCHEMGHLFGERFFTTISGLAVEGEADYFSGYCLMRYLTEVRGMSQGRATAEAEEIAKHEAMAFAQGRLTWQKAYLDFYSGINRSYPANECRLLTVLHGVWGWKRPSCWYNPKAMAILKATTAH